MGHRTHRLPKGAALTVRHTPNPEPRCPAPRILREPESQILCKPPYAYVLATKIWDGQK